MNELDLAPGLSLPAAQAGTQTYAWIARKGGGKSYGASKLAELLHGAGVPLIVIDPVGIWWGLRLAADGFSPGLPIPVIGGRNGDVPLPPDEGLGERLAIWLIGANASAVIDVSEMRKAERKRFVAEFAEALFHAAKGKRRPRMVVLEEAQTFAPQIAKGQERMLGAIEDIVRLGRNYGIGAMLVTQRPQSVNKEVLNQVECLFVGQLPAKHERDAIKGWIVAKGDSELGDYVEKLPSLKVGDFFCWSPQWLECFERIRVHPKKTYDASSTPTLDAEAVIDAPAPLAAPDLEALRALLQPAPEKALPPADAWGPPDDASAELATRLELAEARAAYLEEARQIVRSRLASALATLRTSVSDAQAALRHFEDIAGVDSATSVTPPLVATSQSEVDALLGSGGLTMPRPAGPIVTVRAPAQGQRASNGGGLGRCERAALGALAYAGPSSIVRVALLAGYKHSGGGFRNALSSLRTAGLIKGSGIIEITGAGRAKGGPRPPTGAALVARWCSELGACERAVLQVMVGKVGLRTTSAGYLADQTGYQPEGGGFRNSISRLRSLGLLQGGQNGIALGADIAKDLLS